MHRFVHTTHKSKSITLVHMSDIHIWQPQLFTTPIGIVPIIRNNSLRDMKQLQGYLNVTFNRGPDTYDPILFTTALTDICKNQYDHVVITGDITNISLQDEFIQSRTLLNDYYLKQRMVQEEQGDAWRFCTAIPGNHDTYTPTSVETDLFGKYFGDMLGYQTLPNNIAPSSLYNHFPAIKVIQTSCKTTNVVILSINSSVPTKPFVSAGYIGYSQLQHASQLLDAVKQNIGKDKLFKVLLMHHPPIIRHKIAWKEKLHGLSPSDKEAIDAFCDKEEINLLLNGHTHKPYLERPLSNKNTLVIDNGSSTYKSGRKYPIGRHHVYTIENAKVIECFVRVWDKKERKYIEKRINIK